MPDTVPSSNSTTKASSAVSTSPMAPCSFPRCRHFLWHILLPLDSVGPCKWVQSLEYFLIAYGITDPKQKRAVLPHLARPEVQDVFTTLQDTGEDYAAVLTRLMAYFEPKMNMPFERHIFRSAAQMPNEPLAS